MMLAVLAAALPARGRDQTAKLLEQLKQTSYQPPSEEQWLAAGLRAEDLPTAQRYEVTIDEWLEINRSRRTHQVAGWSCLGLALLAPAIEATLHWGERIFTLQRIALVYLLVALPTPYELFSSTWLFSASCKKSDSTILDQSDSDTKDTSQNTLAVRSNSDARQTAESSQFDEDALFEIFDNANWDGRQLKEVLWDNGVGRIVRGSKNKKGIVEWLEQWPNGCPHQRIFVDANGVILRRIYTPRTGCTANKQSQVKVNAWYVLGSDTDYYEGIHLPERIEDGRWKWRWDEPRDPGYDWIDCTQGGKWKGTLLTGKGKVVVRRKTHCVKGNQTSSTQVCLGAGFNSCRQMDELYLWAHFSADKRYATIHIPLYGWPAFGWKGDTVWVVDLKRKSWLGQMKLVVDASFEKNGLWITRMDIGPRSFPKPGVSRTSRNCYRFVGSPPTIKKRQCPDNLEEDSFEEKEFSISTGSIKLHLEDQYEKGYKIFRPDLVNIASCHADVEIVGVSEAKFIKVIPKEGQINACAELLEGAEAIGFKIPSEE